MSLAAIQYLVPDPASHRVDDIVMDSVDGDVHSRGEGRVVKFFNGKKEYRVATLPHVGPADADYVIVKYFDYTCDACRDMHEELDFLLGKYEGQLAVIVLPTPLRPACCYCIADASE